MTKTEIIKALARAKHMSIHQATEVVDFLIDAVIDELKNGGKVTITGFGTFSVHELADKPCRNPRTGETMVVKAHKKVCFKDSKMLRSAVVSESKQS